MAGGQAFEAFDAPNKDEKLKPSMEAGSALPLASRSKRMMNSLIDSLSIALAIVLLEMGRILGEEAEVVGSSPVIVAWPFVLALVFLAYLAGMEAWTGRTLGKYITGTKVVRLDGSAITWWQAILRTILRLVPYESVTFLFSRAGLHDRWSGTRVVELNPSNDQLE
ncbi:MAG: RDD family protein [Myxococcota bacterium]